MTRRAAVVGIAIVVVVAALVAAPFAAEKWWPLQTSPRGEGTSYEEPSSRIDDAGRAVQRQPRQRSTDPDAYAEFRRYVEDRRAAGKPTTLRELLGPDPPDADNAGVEIKAALDAVTAELGDESTWPKCGPWGMTPIEDATPEEVEELRQFVKRFGPFLDRVATALDRPRCRFPVPDLPGELYERSIRPMQRTSRILMAVANSDAGAGERTNAIRTLLQLVRKEEPVGAVSLMVDCAATASALRAIRSGVESGKLDLAQTRVPIGELLRSDWISRGPEFVDLQLVELLSGYAAWIDGRITEFGAAVDASDLETPAAAEVVAAAELMEQVAGVPTSPFAAYAQKLGEIREMGEQRDDVSASFAPMPSLIVRRLAEVDAATRLARVALTVAEHRATHGDFPGSLDDLKPMFPEGVPVNPMTDAPFVYAPTPTGVRIATEVRSDDEEHEQNLRDKCLVWDLKR